MVKSLIPHFIQNPANQQYMFINNIITYWININVNTTSYMSIGTMLNNFLGLGIIVQMLRLSNCRYCRLCLDKSFIQYLDSHIPYQYQLPICLAGYRNWMKKQDWARWMQNFVTKDFFFVSQLAREQHFRLTNFISLFVLVFFLFEKR